MDTKLRVGVIMGGMSIERDVSLNSGRTICDHLDTSMYDVIPLFQHIDGTIYILPWRFLHRGKIVDFAHRLEDEAPSIRWDELPEHIDFLYSALHGRYGEDGALQGMCELLDIPYLGSGILATASTIDKWYQKDILNHLNVAYPKTVRVAAHTLPHYQANPEQLTEHLQQNDLTFPVIVKPRCEGSSLGVSKVYTCEELISALSDAIYIDTTAQDALIQECIDGTEICQILIADDAPDNIIALPPTEIVHENGTNLFDYSQKYMPGRAYKYTPARCDDALIQTMQEIAKTVAQAFELRTFVRIDYMVAHDGTPYVIDINSFPGTAPSGFPFLQAAEIGLSHTDVINRCIAVELRNQGMERIPQLQGNRMKQTDDRLQVAVLLGGSCHEREVSLESGRNACYKLSPHKYAVTPVFVSKDHKLYTITQRQLVRNTTDEIEHLVTKEQQLFWSDLPDRFDFAFLGLHGGIGENGVVQGALDMLRMPYNGSPAGASALCMDKYKTHQHLQRHGFHVPHHQLISRHAWNNQTYTIDIPLPCIVKPHDDGSSVNVIKAQSQDELDSAIQHIFADNNNGVLIEEVIDGMELTVGVIGNETAYAFEPSYAVAQSDILSMEEKFLPGAGENQTPAPLDEATRQFIRREVELVYQALGCKGYARIDCFYQNSKQSPTGQERVVFLEPNTLPALTPATCIFHQAAEAGLKPMELFDIILEFGQLRFSGDEQQAYHTIETVREKEAI